MNTISTFSSLWVWEELIAGGAIGRGLVGDAGEISPGGASA